MTLLPRRVRLAAWGAVNVIVWWRWILPATQNLQ